MPQWTEQQQWHLIISLRILGAIVGGVVTALGLYYLISGRDTSGSTTDVLKNVVLDVYRIIFGILIMVCEARWKYLLVWFSFLLYYIGMGFFYVFVGGLALGTNWYEYIVTIVAVCIGVAYCGVGCCCADLEEKHRAGTKTQLDAVRM